MIPVLVATHDEGVVRVYYRHSDGTVTQTARFVAPAIDPPGLAALVANLGDELHWGNGTAPKPPKPVKAIATPKKPRSRTRAGADEMARRRGDMLAWLATHTDATAAQAGAALYPNAVDQSGKARKILSQLVDAGHAEQSGGTGQPGDGLRYQTRTQT